MALVDVESLQGDLHRRKHEGVNRRGRDAGDRLHTGQAAQTFEHALERL